MFRRSVLFLLTTHLLGCELATQGDPAIPMVTIPGTFVVAMSGELDAALNGTATTSPASGAGPRTVELRSATNASVRVVFTRGLLGSSTFDFAEGEYSLAGIPGFRDVDAIFYLSAAAGDEFFATSGTFEIVTSGPEIIRGRFEFTGVSASGAAMRQVRARGTFWSVPAAP